MLGNDGSLYEAVGKYLDKYYVEKTDEIRQDRKKKSVFDRISGVSIGSIEDRTAFEIDENAVGSFDVESMQKTKTTDAMSSTLETNRNLESLMGQMGETFS